MAEPETIGLIAGQSRLPVMVAKGAKKAGCKVVCLALAGAVDQSLKEYVDFFYPVPLARPGNWIRKLKKHNITSTIMVGRVAKSNIHTPFRILKYLPDWRALRIWYFRLRRQDKRADKILKAVADELASGGIILENSTMYCAEQMAPKGAVTKNQPSKEMLDDINFGWEIAKNIAAMDIGQAIAVKEKDILAVEAIEGTAEMIKRAGELCKRPGWTLIKVAKPNQDMRFDVPTVGIETIKDLAENNGRCLVVEANKTIIVDREKTVELAQKLNITIYGYDDNNQSAP